MCRAGAAAPDVVPVRKLNDAAALVELYHGPTHCFKDLGLQVAVWAEPNFKMRAVFGADRGDAATWRFRGRGASRGPLGTDRGDAAGGRDDVEIPRAAARD